MISKSILAIVLFLCACSSHGYVYEVEVNNIASGKLVQIPLDSMYNMQKMVMLENTADDTFLIGIMKVPPGKTGELYNIEFRNTEDSLNYEIKSYRATRGRVRFNHIFYNY
jgi:hypothetical protein